MSDMELTDVEGEVREGELVAANLSEVTVGQTSKRKRVETPETVGVSECAVVRLSTFPEKVRDVGRDLDRILQAEKEKKKISAAAQRSNLEIRERYEAMLDEAFRQNTVLLGRIEELRESRMRDAGSERGAAVTPQPKKSEEVKKAKGVKKDKVEKTVLPSKTKETKEVAFVEVVGKKKKRKKKKEEEVKESSGVAKVTPKAAKAIERVKARAPARAFVVSVGEAKRQLWADLVKGVAVPKLGGSAKLPRGDIVVKPADDATYAVLKAMESQGKGVREESARWPTVLVYDVDRDISKEKLAGQIADQNPELGLDREAVVPLFMKGPKTDELAWWVCSVRPSAFKALVGKSLFIGLNRCKVKEFTDVVRCFKCQRFGHRASKCQQTVDTCGRCASKGHRAKDCQSVPVKCANCGQAARSGHAGCSALLKATFTVARRTDFGSQ